MIRLSGSGTIAQQNVVQQTVVTPPAVSALNQVKISVNNSVSSLASQAAGNNSLQAPHRAMRSQPVCATVSSAPAISAIAQPSSILQCFKSLRKRSSVNNRSPALLVPQTHKAAQGKVKFVAAEVQATCLMPELIHSDRYGEYFPFDGLKSCIRNCLENKHKQMPFLSAELNKLIDKIGIIRPRATQLANADSVEKLKHEINAVWHEAKTLMMEIEDAFWLKHRHYLINDQPIRYFYSGLADEQEARVEYHLVKERLVNSVNLCAYNLVYRLTHALQHKMAGAEMKDVLHHLINTLENFTHPERENAIYHMLVDKTCPLYVLSPVVKTYIDDDSIISPTIFFMVCDNFEKYIKDTLGDERYTQLAEQLKSERSEEGGYNDIKNGLSFLMENEAFASMITSLRAGFNGLFSDRLRYDLADRLYVRNLHPILLIESQEEYLRVKNKSFAVS